MNGIPLHTITCERDIGVTITNHLKPADHCKQVANTAKQIGTKSNTQIFPLSGNS